MGPTAGLDGCGKSRPPPGFDPRIFHPVTSRYIDWAIPALWDVWVQRANVLRCCSTAGSGVLYGTKFYIWRPLSRLPVVHVSGQRNVVFWNDKRQMYLMFHCSRFKIVFSTELQNVCRSMRPESFGYYLYRVFSSNPDTVYWFTE
jgi:hypothetical protein